MRNHEDSPGNTGGRLLLLLRVAGIPVVGALLLLQAYIAVVQTEGDSPLPALFGNFPANRAFLEKQDPKKDFSFAVIGDTRSHGVFERIVEKLRKIPLDFAVLLGDCTRDGTEEEHRYFRAENAREYALPFPVFYLVGNHDISSEHFPIRRFERDYGPSIFSFEYQGCLFIALRVLPEPFINQESIAFLGKFRDIPPEKYRKIFVFMHTPPQVSPVFSVRNFKEHNQLVTLFGEIGVDYVLAADFHGYAHVRSGTTTYVVSGGGGARLHGVSGRQFHHAFVMRVGENAVSEQIVTVSQSHDFEDRLEAFAISEAWPWMTRNAVLVCALDIVCLFLLLILIVPAGLGVFKEAAGR